MCVFSVGAVSEPPVQNLVIVGIFDYNMSPKKTVRENIENNFFDEIVKSVEFYSDEIVALFTCLRFEIYIYSNNKIN